MNLTLIAILSAVSLFFGMLLFFEAGRRFGIARLSRDPEGLAKGTGAAEGAVFGLLGLILALPRAPPPRKTIRLSSCIYCWLG